MVVKEDLRIARVEEDEADFLDGGGSAKEGLDGGGDDRGGLFARIAVSAGGDGREGDGAKRMLRGESERVAVAAGQQVGVGLMAAAHDWADGVDDMLCGERSGSGDCSLTGGQAAGKLRGAQFAALFQNSRAAATMDGAIHAASAEKGAVGGVNDGVDVLGGDVADQDEDAAVQKSLQGGGHGEGSLWMSIEEGAAACPVRRLGFGLLRTCPSPHGLG